MTGRTWTALPVVLAFTAGAAQAGEKVLVAPPPAWVVPAPDPDTGARDDAPLLLVHDQQQRIAGGVVTGYVETASRIASAEMLNQAGTVRLVWQPHDGDLTVHRIEILRGAERIDRLKGQSFQVIRREQQLEQMWMDGMLTATLPVEGLRVGDVLRIAFSISEREETLAGQVQSVLPLVSEPMKVGFGRVRVSWPKGAAPRWKALVDGVATTRLSQAGDEGIELRLPLAKPAEMPDDAPVRYRRPALLEVSSFADWQAVSRAEAPLYAPAGLIAAGSPLAAEVAKIRAASTDPRLRAAAALRLVQDEVRYLYNGMSGGNYRPQAPARTWEARYGDCKAKTLLLLALLDALEIKAEAVLASIEGGDLVPLRLPAPLAFNHVLVRAEVGDKVLWLDGTGTGTRIEDMEDAPPFRHVLPLRKGGADLMALASRAPRRPQVQFAMDVDYSAGLSLPAPYRVSMTLRGGDGKAIEVGANQGDREQITSAISGMLRPFMDAGIITRHSIKYDPASGLTNFLVEGITPSEWEVWDNRRRAWLDSTLAAANFNPDRTRAAWTAIPVQMPIAVHLRTQVNMKLPDGGKGFALDGVQRFDGPVAGSTVARSVTLRDGWVRLDDRVTGDAGEIAPAAISEAKALMARLKAQPLALLAPAGYPAQWQEVDAARKAGRLRPIEDSLARYVALDPKSAQAYNRRANFRADVYDWRGALADVDQVVALEPSVDNYLWRARLHRLLNDDARALADMEAARRLEPGSSAAAAALATLKAEQGKVDEALALLDAGAPGASDAEAARTARAETLAIGKRPTEALAAMDAAVAAKPGNPNLLNQRCWIKGQLAVSLDTALKDCTKAIELAESPNDALDSRALVYLRMNRLDDALADIDAALALSPGTPASMYLRGLILKRQGKNGETELAAARMQSPRIAEEYERFGIR